MGLCGGFASSSSCLLAAEARNQWRPPLDGTLQVYYYSGYRCEGDRPKRSGHSCLLMTRWRKEDNFKVHHSLESLGILFRNFTLGQNGGRTEGEIENAPAGGSK